MHDPAAEVPATAPYDGEALDAPTPDGVATSDAVGFDEASASLAVGGGRHQASAPDRTADPDRPAGPEQDAAAQEVAVLGNQVAAFTLLADTLADTAPTGQGWTAAGIKSVMLRRHGFDESLYGFKTFRLFLRAAAAAGHVALDEPTEHGKVDVRVRSAAPTATQSAATAPATAHSPDTQAIIAQPTTGHPALVHATSGGGVPAHSTDEHRDAAPSTAIRQDLWEVFFDWRQDLLRYWDRTQNQAFVFTAEPRAGEPDAVARRRTEVLQRPGDFVVIDHVTLDQQVQWVRDFVDTLSDEQQAPELRACVDQARPIAALTRYLREHESLQRKWKAYRQKQVRAAIVSWMGRHGLTIDIAGSVPAKRSLPLPSDLRASHSPGVDQANDPREQILAAVHRMTLADLLRLPIPAEYFLSS